MPWIQFVIKIIKFNLLSRYYINTRIQCLCWRNKLINIAYSKESIWKISINFWLEISRKIIIRIPTTKQKKAIEMINCYSVYNCICNQVKDRNNIFINIFSRRTDKISFFHSFLKESQWAFFLSLLGFLRFLRTLSTLLMFNKRCSSLFLFTNIHCGDVF